MLTITLVFALTSCDNNDDKDKYTPLYTNPATIPLSFVSSSGVVADGSFNVTVKSDDTYLPNVWDGLVNSVKTALETAYASPDVESGDRGNFRNVFGMAGATVVLQNGLATNWEVKGVATQEVLGVLYVKTDAISTITAISYGAAAASMAQNNPATSLTNAAPPRQRTSACHPNRLVLIFGIHATYSVVI
jgi:hypothetical protein